MINPDTTNNTMKIFCCVIQHVNINLV